MDVTETDALERFHLVAHRRHGGEEIGCFLHRHVEHIGNRLALEQYFQRLAVVALAVADIAGDVDIGQEVHLDLDDTIALAGLAAPALDVEGEAARRIAARLGFGKLREPFADRRERAGIGSRVGARGAPDRALVDVDDLVEVFQPLNRAMRGRDLARAVDAPRGRLVQCLDQEGRLAAARNPGDAGEQPERNFSRDVFQIVAGGVFHADAAALLGRTALVGQCDGFLAGQIFTGERGRIGHHFAGRPLRHDLAAVNAGSGADIHKVVGGENGVFVMFDHDHRITEIAQMPQRVEQARIVALVQADRRLVQHVEHAGQAGADLRGESYALALAARKRAGIARQGEVVQADIIEKAQPLADFL